MKNLIYLLVFCVGMLAGFAALAQAAPREGLLQKADVLRSYRRMKLDMEEKARNVKDMSELTSKDKEEFQLQYNRLRKAFNKFLDQFTEEVSEANGHPLDLCRINQDQLETFLELYHLYEASFLDHYEQLTNTHPAPLVDANFAQQIKNCETKTTVVRPEVFRADYKPDLNCVSWAQL